MFGVNLETEFCARAGARRDDSMRATRANTLNLLAIGSSFFLLLRTEKAMRWPNGKVEKSVEVIEGKEFQGRR